MPKRKFTYEQERRIKEEYESGKSSPQIAKEYGCHKSTIVQAIQRQGGILRKQEITPEEELRIVDMYKNMNLGVVEIVKLLHHDAANISAILRKHNIWIRGSRNFTDEQEHEIAQEYIAGKSARQIARERKCWHICIAAALKRQGVESRTPSERNRLYALNPHKFDDIDCEWKAYFLGFLYADGSVYKRTVRLSLKAIDIEPLQGLKILLESESPIIPYEKKCKDKTYPQNRIEFTDEHLANRLRNLGIIKDRPSFSLAINNIPVDLYSHFLRGFFDGDGSFHLIPGMSFCGREDFMYWIRNYLACHLSVNQDRRVTKHLIANLHYLKYYARKECLLIAEFMYKDATIWLGRKRDKMERWPPPKSRRRDKKGRFI